MASMPLDTSIFTAPDFKPSAFVRTQRGRVNLEQLSAELGAVLTGLKGELSGVIQRDYDDFITLATELGATDREVDGLRHGLSSCEEELRVRARAPSRAPAVSSYPSAARGPCISPRLTVPLFPLSRAHRSCARPWRQRCEQSR